jgi:GNAT superfamily N-acetyltransferase
MSIEIRTEDHGSLAQYATIPILFEVSEVIDLARLAPSGSPLSVQPVSPWVKDYDALPNNHPVDWSRRFDTAAWTVLAAYRANQRLGGAIVVTNRFEAASLGARSDGSLLWDLRVAPSHRRHGVGHALLIAAEAVARAAGSKHLDIETQDSNVPACRLYAAAGFRLIAVTPAAYRGTNNEASLIWTKPLL